MEQPVISMQKVPVSSRIAALRTKTSGNDPDTLAQGACVTILVQRACVTINVMLSVGHTGSIKNRAIASAELVSSSQRAARQVPMAKHYQRNRFDLLCKEFGLLPRTSIKTIMQWSELKSENCAAMLDQQKDRAWSHDRQASESESKTLLHIALSLVRRQFWLLVSCLLTGLFGAAVFLYFVPTIYTATATMLIDSRKGGIQTNERFGRHAN